MIYNIYYTTSNSRKSIYSEFLLKYISKRIVILKSVSFELKQYLNESKITPTSLRDLFIPSNILNDRLQIEIQIH